MIDEYLVWLSDNKGRSNTTIVKYRGYLMRLDKAIKHAPLTHLEREQLETFTGPLAVKAGLSGRSRQAIVAAVRGFYKWALRAGHIKHNPADALPYPKAPGKLPIPITLEHAERLIWEPDLGKFIGLRDSTMISIMMGCGLRVSGLAGLHDEDIIATREDGTTRLVLRVSEKGDKERLVPVPREAQMLLQGYIGHPKMDEIDRRTPKGKHVLFITTNNRSIAKVDYVGEARRIRPNGVWKRIKMYGKRLGIPDKELKPHAFRHLYGTELAESDVDIITRQALMGHADPKSTKVYTHLASRKLLETTDKANPLGKMKTPVSKLLETMT